MLLFIVLSNVPTRPRSAWQIYLRENINKYKFPNGKIDMKKATIESGAIWKSMGEAQKKVCKHWCDFDWLGLV